MFNNFYPHRISLSRDILSHENLEIFIIFTVYINPYEKKPGKNRIQDKEDTGVP